MYIHELSTFIAVVECGSFNKAAAKLYATTPAVMNQINKLEYIVGAKLVERSNKGVTLTAAGKSLYKDGKELIEFSEKAMKNAREIASINQHVINIGTSVLRPCRQLIDLLDDIDDETLPFSVNIVPFNDDPSGLEAVLSSLGTQIDCIVSPCDSIQWRKSHSILQLGRLPCRIAVPRNHRLAKKKSLCWDDLDGETLMIVKSSDTPVLNRMRTDIEANHPHIRIADTLNFYDTSVFNECERMNYLMETLDIWSDIHPSLVTLPMDWDYEIPYGIIYAKRPSEQMSAFIDAVKGRYADK